MEKKIDIEKWVPPIDNGSVSVNLIYPDVEPYFTIDSDFEKLPRGAIEDAIKISKTLENRVTRVYGYFKLNSNGQDVPQFDSILIIKIKYSRRAWELAKPDETTIPRVAFIVRDHANKNWVENWIVFEAPANCNSISHVPPDNKNPYGVITIEVEGLPDPLIGDC